MSFTNNVSQFKGKLTKDAQFTVSPNGKQLYKFSLAVSTKKPKMENGQQVNNAQGKPEFEVMFVEFVAFGKVAETLVNGSLHPMLAKGAFVQVDARFDGVSAYIKTDGTAGASAKFVIESPLDVSVIGTSFNQREDGATYQPPTRQSSNNGQQMNGQQAVNNQQQGNFNQQQQQGGFGGYNSYNDMPFG